MVDQATRYRPMDLGYADGPQWVVLAEDYDKAVARIKELELFQSDRATALEVEADYQRSKVVGLEAENQRLRELLRTTVPALTDIVRMPNVEHVADAHNEAVRRLKEES